MPKPRYDPVAAYNSPEFVNYLDWEAAKDLKPRTQRRVDIFLSTIDSDTAQEWAAEYWEWICKRSNDEPKPYFIRPWAVAYIKKMLWDLVRREADEADKLERDARNYYKNEVAGL